MKPRSRCLRPLGRFLITAGSLVVLPLAASATDLCQGLVQDRDPHPMSALAQPALGQAVTDPQFRGRIRRITAAPPSGSGDAAIVPMYSTVSAWNADESRLILYHVGRGHELYDGRSYAFIRALDIAPTDIEQVYWHTSDPDVLFYPTGKRLVRYHVSSGVQETVHTFDFCNGDVGGGSDPMFMAWDSRAIGLSCDATMFVYRIATDSITATAPTSGSVPQVAPSGSLALLDGSVVDLGLHVLRRLDLADPFEHAGLGRMANGRDTLNAVAFDPGPAGSGVGSLVTFDIQDGTSRTIVGPAAGFPYPPSTTHISTLAYRDPGWTFLSIVGDPAGQGVLDNEIVLADTNSGRVCRVAHHRSWGRNNTNLQSTYWAEPHVVASPSGTRAVRERLGQRFHGGDVRGGASGLPAPPPVREREPRLQGRRSACPLGHGFQRGNGRDGGLLLPARVPGRRPCAIRDGHRNGARATLTAGHTRAARRGREPAAAVPDRPLDRPRLRLDGGRAAGNV